MADVAELKQKLEELAKRQWNLEEIVKRVEMLQKNGIPQKVLDPNELKNRKEEIVKRVQRRAEEYNYVLKNCARGTALALMEEFGVGNVELIKALTPFPGVGSTGEVCGGITGSLMVFGLIFGSDDWFDFETMNRVITLSQKFIAFFEDELGYIHCADIIENIVIGERLNPGESDEAMARFAEKGGFEKCGLATGTGARLAASFIIDNL